MLRLFFLFLILRGAAATSEDTEENSSGDMGDDEDDTDTDISPRHFPGTGAQSPETGESPGSGKSTADTGPEDGTLIIIIAAVSVAILAIGGIAAIVLFRRYMQSREQGVYTVPAEQGQKAAV